MLQTLKIRNVALASEVTLNFDEKLNVISGETGAGKSIMLDSLSFVFGGRADRSLIRTGENFMKVEAVFVGLCDSHKKYVKNELSIDCDDELFLSRELDINGKNTCKINGELVPVASVKKVCQMLVDVHGQSEHLAILDNDYQLKIIDLFSKQADSILMELNEEIEKYKSIEKQIKDLGGSETEKQNLIDLYTYQINEIKNANIQPKEYEDLTNEKKEMQQYEKINNSLNLVLQVCEKSEETSIVNALSNCVKFLQQISELNDHYKELMNRFSSTLIEVEDLGSTINLDIENNIFDQQRYNEIDERLDLIKSMFRKYGGSYEEMSKYFSDISIKLDNLINSSEKYKQLTLELEKVLVKIEDIQNKLTKIRKDSAKVLIGKMESELKVLGMPNAKLDIYFSRIPEKFSHLGCDMVEFMFSSNLGFEVKPLNKVVSGGEMSRVMLAYKIVVSEVDSIHTIVFDEIDSGLSGNIALVVAEYMARLSLNKQIIAVSHLPQICAMADNNIKVEKFSDKTSTHTRAINLNNDELLYEISRLMGTNLDEKGLSVSRDLKIKLNQYKNNLQK